jgi:UDP-GlcNAc:undecaprenyl-phosphate GlcNAc-1-phosphate transferase
VQAHPEIAIYGFLFIFSFFVTLASVPMSIQLAGRLRALDYPAERKVHGTPVPRLGGLAVFAGVWLAILAGSGFNSYLREGMRSILGIVIGSLVIVGLGIVDDIHNAKPLAKLAVQIVAAGIAVAMGIRFELASNPLANAMRDSFDLGILGIPLSILWIIALTNAMNLIDGLDGLATGIAMFTSIALFLISIKQGAGVVTYFYAAIAGATLAFLKYNHHPARVFLGDSGSTFLGFLLACLSIKGAQKSYTLTAVFIPLIVFGIPIFDSITSLVRRYLGKQKVHHADSHHIHHRLLRAGLNQKQVVFLLYAITIFLGIIGFCFTVLLDEYAAVIVIIIGWIAGFTAKELDLFGRQRRQMEREKGLTAGTEEESHENVTEVSKRAALQKR